MTNKMKALKRERIRLRKSQNPQQVDYKKMDTVRSVKTEFWKMKKRDNFEAKKSIAKAESKKAKKVKPEKDKKKKEKKPELEVIEDKPELEVIEEEDIEEIEEEPELEIEDVEIDKELEDRIVGKRVTFTEWAENRGISRNQYGAAYAMKKQPAPKTKGA